MIAGRLMMAARVFAVRVVRAAAGLAGDKRLPRWLRAVLVIACLPIPGPVDNGVQLLVLLIVLAHPVYRRALVDAWQGAALRGQLLPVRALVWLQIHVRWAAVRPQYA